MLSSVWDDSAVQSMTAKIESLPCSNPFEFWGGFDAEQRSLLRQRDKQSSLLLSSADARVNPAEIRKLRNLEVASELMRSWFSLTDHKDTRESNNLRRRAEERVRRVIDGNRPTGGGFTLSTQLGRFLEEADPDTNKGWRVDVSHEML